jgi:AAA domain
MSAPFSVPYLDVADPTHEAGNDFGEECVPAAEPEETNLDPLRVDTTLENEEPRVSSLAEVLGEKKGETHWVVKNLLAVGAIGLLSGDYYIGKTTVTALLLSHVAAGRRFLGFEIARPLPVLYWSAEGNRKMFAERVACACFHAGIDAATLDFGLPPVDFVPPFDSQEFARFVIASGRGLVACDSVGYFMNDKADENSATDWKKYVMKPLYAISRKTGASFFLTHHYSKPAENRMGRHRIRGSSAIGSDCDTVMRLEAPNGDGAPQRKLFIDKVRNEEKPGTLSLTFEPRKALVVLDEAAGEYVEPAPKETREKARQAAKDETDRKAKGDVELLFRRSPSGLTAVEIEKAFHRGRQWVADTVGELYARGSIRRDVREQKNAREQVRSMDVWKWSENPPEDGETSKTRQAEMSPNPDNLSLTFSPRTPLSSKTRQDVSLGSPGDVPEDSSKHVKTRQDTSESGGA